MKKKLLLSVICVATALCFASLPALAQDGDEITNSIGMKFVLLPAGSFVMGENPPLSEGKSDEHPPHEVIIEKPFYMGAHEVTQDQWEKVMKSNPSRHKGHNRPVDSVS